MPITTRPPLCSDLIAPSDSAMISPLGLGPGWQFEHAVAGQIDAMRFMDQAVQDGVGIGWVAVMRRLLVHRSLQRSFPKAIS